MIGQKRRERKGETRSRDVEVEEEGWSCQGHGNTQHEQDGQHDRVTIEGHIDGYHASVSHDN